MIGIFVTLLVMMMRLTFMAAVLMVRFTFIVGAMCMRALSRR